LKFHRRDALWQVERAVRASGPLLDALPEPDSKSPLLPMNAEALLDYTINGRVQGQRGNRHPTMAPHGCYPCKGDDEWVVISVAADAQWERFCQALGSPAAWLAATNSRAATTNTKVVGSWNPSFPRAAPIT